MVYYLADSNSPLSKAGRMQGCPVTLFTLLPAERSMLITAFLTMSLSL